MNNFIIIFIDGKTEEVKCEFTAQREGIIKFCNIRKSMLEQQLKGSEVVMAVNEKAIRYFKKVN